MTTDQITYAAFGLLVVIALIFDLGLLSKKSSHITIRKALWQTVFWVSLAVAFMFFVWYEYGQQIAIEYLSAYLTEWSLSIDNIFVFILLFTFFGMKDQYSARVLLIGILMAIVFRVIFITVGIALVERFGWLLYIFGAILVITGVKMFAADSIPAVFGISTHRVVIYTSNIFAVLGLRSLFFLLRGAVGKFAYLQQGIAIVLVFIGLKMLVEFFNVHVPIFISLLVILVCIVTSIVYSMSVSSREAKKDIVNKGDVDLH